MKNAYRRYFPDALPELEEYLRHPETYRSKTAFRLHEVSSLAGCQINFA